MQKLIFHIGVHRTGTSAVQQSLARSRDMLSEHGFCYPGDQEKHGWINHRLGSAEGVDEIAAWLAGEARADTHTIILSCEDFTRHTDLTALKMLRDRFDLGCIAYLRRQDDWLNSWYAENMWWPWQGSHWNSSPEQFLDAWRHGEFHWIDYDRLIGRWADAVGPGNMTVRRFGGPPLANFKEHLDLPELQEPSGQVNASPPASVLPLLARFGPGGIPDGARWRLNQAVLSAAAEIGLTGRRSVFSPAQRRDILATYAESNAKVARSWFGDDALFDERGIDGEYVDLDSLDADALTLQMWPLIARRLAQRP